MLILKQQTTRVRFCLWITFQNALVVCVFLRYRFYGVAPRNMQNSAFIQPLQAFLRCLGIQVAPT
jgi:hypothetical protein